MSMWRTVRDRLPDVEKDDVLEMLGLESRRSTSERVLPVLAVFGAGLVVGVGVGLMFAQKPGRELRDDIRHRLKRGEKEHNGEAIEEPVGVS